jgi:hypothetical protein
MKIRVQVIVGPEDGVGEIVQEIIQLARGPRGSPLFPLSHFPAFSRRSEIVAFNSSQKPSPFLTNLCAPNILR